MEQEDKRKTMGDISYKLRMIGDEWDQVADTLRWIAANYEKLARALDVLEELGKFKWVDEED